MSLVRGMDRILGRQVSVLPPRCTVYSFQRKRRKRRGKRERKWRLTVATFLQPSVLILSRLTLRHSSTWPVCSWAAASSAHRLAICMGHTQGRGQPSSGQAPGPLHHQAHGPPTAVPGRLSNGSLVAFTPLPPHGMLGSALLHKDWQRAEKPVHTRIFMLSASRPESDCPRTGHKDYCLIPQEEGQIAK